MDTGPEAKPRPVAVLWITEMLLVFPVVSYSMILDFKGTKSVWV